MRVFSLVVLVLLVAAPAAAQRTSPDIVANAGAGGSYYCIVSRCDTGVVLAASAAVSLTRFLAVEVGARWHGCPDCSRFVIGEAALLVQYPGVRVRPYAGGGVAYSSDPDFMGSHAGAMAAVGSSVRLAGRWDLRLDVRGRQVGRGDAMGEAALLLGYRP